MSFKHKPIMDHGYHHVRIVKHYVVAARDLGITGTPNQSATLTTSEQVAGVLLLRDMWYYQIWVTVCSKPSACFIAKALCSLVFYFLISRKLSVCRW